MLLLKIVLYFSLVVLPMALALNSPRLMYDRVRNQLRRMMSWLLSIMDEHDWMKYINLLIANIIIFCLMIVTQIVWQDKDQKANPNYLFQVDVVNAIRTI